MKNVILTFIAGAAIRLGVAASKASKPTQTRLRSLMNHTVFGIGLFVFGSLVSWLLFYIESKPI
jgi:hypothetical protein